VSDVESVLTLLRARLTWFDVGAALG
jgi:hypothetical protein